MHIFADLIVVDERKPGITFNYSFTAIKTDSNQTLQH
jgi:hypothetical protein